MSRIRTPIMWPGNKTNLIKTIGHVLPKFDAYIEPFCGGAGLYFELLKIYPKMTAFLSDINQELIHFLITMRDRPMELIDAMPDKKDKQLYLQYRNNPDGDAIYRAVRFIYLNRNSFFGLGGWMNADRYAIDSVKHRITYFSPRMSNTEFSHNGYMSFLGKADETSFTFFDPPYLESNNVSCYKQEDQSTKIHLELFTLLSNLPGYYYLTTKMSDSLDLNILTENGINFSIEKWSYRKPQRGVIESQELHITNLSRKNCLDSILSV